MSPAGNINGLTLPQLIVERNRVVSPLHQLYPHPLLQIVIRMMIEKQLTEPLTGCCL
jgi:hypothetical protein